MIQRIDGRRSDQLRPMRAYYDVYGYSDASVLFEAGNTKVHCAVSRSYGVPPFLKGKKTGWLTAEYAMLPTATGNRTMRDFSAVTRNGRAVEISRLIGRALRSIVDLEMLGEQTITIDCDVLQADGGTRTACITGASMALSIAASRWLKSKLVPGNIIRDRVAAVSAGIIKGSVLLDLNYQEDSTVDADFNFVINGSGGIIEVQGTAEQAPISWEDFSKIRAVSEKGINDLFAYLNSDGALEKKESVPLFSLKNRFMNT
ncbi:MAG TPA: ribonuclease PH [Candidatus Babeliales bacterium]|nr:ribonuclease PH [Candidatus Babeliales bacterium]